MKINLRFCCVLLALFSVLAARPEISSRRAQYLPDEIIVKVRDGSTDVRALPSLNTRIDLAKSAGEAVTNVFDTKKLRSPARAEAIGLNRIFRVHVLPGTDIDILCAELNGHPDVEWAEPVYILPAEAIPNDPLYSQQTHLPQIQMPAAWDVVKGSPSVPIAILDSGIDWKHPDLKTILWLNPGEDINSDGVLTAADSNGVDDDHNGFIDDFHGWDFVTGVTGSGTSNATPDEDGEEPDNDVMDVNGHGSHCSGLAAAATNNNLGIAGVSWGCRIMMVRIGWMANDSLGYGRSDWMAQGFIYAADNGAKVANLSYGTSGTVIVDAAKYAFMHDVCITTSAGNDNSPISKSLSQVPWVMSVTAVDPYDVKAWYSSYGWQASIAAPGGDHLPGLWSTTPNNIYNDFSIYNAYSGTSMASPVAAGVLGLIRSQHPDWTASQAYFQMVGTADSIDHLNPDYAGLLGAGRVNALRAVTENVIPQPKLALSSIRYYDPNGNNNGLIEPGEEINLVFHLENRWASAGVTTAKIVTADDRLTLKTAAVQLDTLYGLESFPIDNNNLTHPLVIQPVANLAPGFLAANLVIETGSSSDTFAIQIPIHQQVLLVEDNLGGGNGDLPIAHFYREAFDRLGVSYEYWHNTEPIDSNYILKFPVVVWGCEWAFPSLNADDRQILTRYLENGGRLFISGQDIGWDMCDMGSTSNQWKLSGGLSKGWYEKYLATSYINDVGGTSPVSVTAESFFDLPAFEFAQPGRVTDIYPSIVVHRPNEGGFPILKYKSGETAAVAADAPYKTVYFAFGGFEAVTDSNVRVAMMQQILNHFTTVKAQVKIQRSTEFKGPFPITAQPLTTKSIAVAQLWYKINDENWQFTPMTLTGELYSAEIPAVTAEAADISYFVFLKATDGTYYADQRHVFYSGPDRLPPQAMETLIPYDNIDRLGPYPVAFQITDNIAVDTNNVRIHFFSTHLSEDSSLIPHAADDIWSGGFEFSAPVTDSDTVGFYLTFKDLGAVPNFNRLPAEGFFRFVVQNQTLVDNFESGLGRWQNEENFWNIYAVPTSLRKDGMRCLISGDGVKYPPDKNASIVYRNQVNLKSRSQAVVKFIYLQLFEDAGDTAYFEIQQGTGNWLILQKFFGANVTKWKELVFDLNEYCGIGQAPIALRFRMQTNSAAASKVGLLVDKIEILTDDAVGVVNAANAPLIFKLLPAYPNPFNATVSLPFTLPQGGKVELTVFDLLGREVYRTSRIYTIAGRYSLQWNGTNNNRQKLSSGVYFAQLRFDDMTHIQKILLTK